MFKFLSTLCAVVSVKTSVLRLPQVQKSHAFENHRQHEQNNNLYTWHHRTLA